MKTLAAARADARTSRLEFKRSLADVRARLSVRELAEDALGALDPDLGFLRWAQDRIGRNPLLAAALVAGAGLAGGVLAHGKTHNQKSKTSLSKGELP